MKPKPKSKRERRLVAACYNDCERIALERYIECRQGHSGFDSAKDMAAHLANLCVVRKKQILSYGCEIPYRRWKIK